MLHEQRFDTGTVPINYAEGLPNGPPFVVLHGGAACWQYGKAFLEALADRWHVYAPDFRDHGASGHMPGHYQVRDYAADTAAFLAGVVREPAIVFGHSLGGYTALSLAAEHPELVRAVIDGDATLERKGHPVEEPTHKAQNALWQTLAGRPVAGGRGLPAEDARHALQLLRQGSHVRLVGIGHHLYGPPSQIAHLIRAMTPFLEQVLGSESERPQCVVPPGE